MTKQINIGPATLYCGDCLEIIRSVPEVDGCFTDPPYMINMKSDGKGKVNPWVDLINASYWYTEWIEAVRNRLKPTGSLWTCLNWRSIVTYQKAAFNLNWPIENLMIWDKKCIGTGGNRGLRPSYEMVALFIMPEFCIPNRGLPDVQGFMWSSRKPHGHPAEKPEALMEFMISNATKQGDIILDPFMGSGTTGVTAVKMGRRFIGIEQDERWFDAAAERIKSVM